MWSGARSRAVQWYGAERATALVCDFPMPEGAENPAPIEQRGWCITEKRLSSMRKAGPCCLTLSQLPQDVRRDGPGGAWWNVVKACQVNRLAPLTPDEFEKLMIDGMASGAIKFTVRLLPSEPPTPWAGAEPHRSMDRVSRAQNGKDATSICIPQYREAFFRLMSSGGMLAFSRCCWKDAEVKQLVAALQCAHAEGATSQADVLFLRNNQLTDAALPILVEMLEAGVLPCLEKLWLDFNSGLRDVAAKEALKAACDERGVTVGFD